jgi:hypothetical protein
MSAPARRTFWAASRQPAMLLPCASPSASCRLTGRGLAALGACGTGALVPAEACGPEVAWLAGAGVAPPRGASTADALDPCGTGPLWGAAA